MARRFNPYRAWANDGKALSQWTDVPLTIWQQCKTCHQQFSTATMTFVQNECEGCQAKHNSK